MGVGLVHALRRLRRTRRQHRVARMVVHGRKAVHDVGHAACWQLLRPLRCDTRGMGFNLGFTPMHEVGHAMCWQLLGPSRCDNRE